MRGLPEALVNVAPTAPAGSALACDDRWLVVRFASEHDVLSWAPVGGGFRRATAVAWHRVQEEELRPPVDAKLLLEGRMRAASLARAVGLMTSRRLDSYSDARCEWGGVAAHAIATVGLGNALRAGDPPGAAARIGTINVLCQLSVGLSEEALVEALAIVVEARTTAVLESGVTSTISGDAASGTGTDCAVVACPAGARSRAAYAGKHTDVGHVVGASVHRAVLAGIHRWLEEKRAWPKK
jgi:adenosylcobinamide amidohydrolase